MEPVNWAFMGSDPIAIPMLAALAARADARLAAVWTQPDRPHGRGQRVIAGPVKQWALDRGIPVLQPERPGTEDIAALQRMGADMVLVMAYGHLLRPAFLEAAPRGCFNVHTSRLPSYRGASPIQTAVACGEARTAVTLMCMEAGLDTGPLVDAEAVEVGAADTALDVERRMASACVPLLERNFRAMLSGTTAPSPQAHERATYCRRLEKADGVLDFTKSARTLAARVNGLFPWPCCSIVVGELVIKLGRANAYAAEVPAEPGTVVGERDGALEIATGDGVLRLLELQRPGGKLLPAREFLRGFPIPAGHRLPSLPMTPLVDIKPFPWKRPGPG